MIKGCEDTSNANTKERAAHNDGYLSPLHPLQNNKKPGVVPGSDKFPLDYIIHFFP